jgi:ABC-type phosphate transport system substrate-binding protein
MQWGYTMSGLKMGNTRMKLLAGAVMFLAGATLATSAMSTQLYGGGATLPAGGYVGFNWVSTNTRLVPDTGVTINPTSLFGAWASSTGNTVQYCQTGSGGGKRVLDGDSTTLPSLTPAGLCGSFNPPPAQQNAGFQIPSTAIGQPDFVASDAPISPSEYSTFVTNRGAAKGEPIQFPAIVGSIAVIYHNTDTAVGTKINLTTTQVCQIFAGTLTNWNQINSAYASKAINVVFRSDGSGTTFNTMNHLNAVCGTAVPSGHFVVDQSFATATAGLPIASSSSKTGASGNPAVIIAANGIDGAIGYAETSNALNQGLANTHYATVDSKDPVTDLPATFNVTSGSVVFDKTVSADPSTGAAILNTLVPNSTANCLAVVTPSSFNNPSTGYSIIGVSYLLANQKGNSTNLNTLRSFLAFPYTHAGTTLPGGLSFIGNTGISTLKINSCTAA